MYDSSENRVERTVNIVREAEQKVAELLKGAADELDYRTIQRITEYACKLRAVYAPDSPQSRTRPDHVQYAPAADNQARRNIPAEQYFVRNDNVVRERRKPNSQGTYKNQSPKFVVDAVASALTTGRVAGKPIKVNRLLEIMNAQTASRSFNRIQLDTSLGWLQSIGVVTKVAHGQYAIQNVSEAQQSISAHWTQLSQSVG